jgi:hypothetical protein
MSAVMYMLARSIDFAFISTNFLLEFGSEIIGDHFITAPTHEIADALAARNTTVFLYNFEYRSEYQRKDEGLLCLLFHVV